MKLDILAIAVHPDDVELSCSGTLISHIHQGKKVGVLDLTRGEMGTRGTPETRAQESAEATRIMGLHARENLGFRDIFFVNDEWHKLEVVKMLRKYQPEIVLANAVFDRHPDHIRASELVEEACFWSGLANIKTDLDGSIQAEWRPKNVYHYVQSRYVKPDFIVDVTPYWAQKMEAIRAFKSQFYVPGTGVAGKETFISTPAFMQFLEARGREYGMAINVEFGEGFTSAKAVGVKDIFGLL
jgi:bacillithiol biosynthesis deacetylase BshB1